MKKRNKSNNTIQIGLSDNITQDQLSSIIANGIVKAQDIQAQREKEKQIQVTKELEQAFSIVKVPEKKGIKKRFFTLINDIWFFISAPYKHFDTSIDNRITLNAVKMLLMLFLMILQSALWISDILGIIYLYRNFTYENLMFFIMLVAFVHLLLFVFHGIKLEINSMNDNTLLFNIAAFFIAVSALTVSIITLVHGG